MPHVQAFFPAAISQSNRTRNPYPDKSCHLTTEFQNTTYNVPLHRSMTNQNVIGNEQLHYHQGVNGQSECSSRWTIDIGSWVCEQPASKWKSRLWGVDSWLLSSVQEKWPKNVIVTKNLIYIPKTGWVTAILFYPKGMRMGYTRSYCQNVSTILDCST